MQQPAINLLYHRIHKLFFQRVTDQCSHMQLHPGQIPLIQCLKGMGSCSQTMLSQKLRVSPAAVAVSLKRLEKQGMVKKSVNPDNQRENVIALTQKGKCESNAIDLAFHNVVTKALEGINENELELLSQMLVKICDNLTLSKDEEKNI